MNTVVRQTRYHPLGNYLKRQCYWWNDDDERQQWRIMDKNGKRQFIINSDIWLSLTVFTHVECRVVESIANKGWELLTHTKYSPIEAPKDYHVNRLLKNEEKFTTIWMT